MDRQDQFFFKGTLPSSKSLMNRALICSSFSNSLRLIGDSSCDDVEKMKKAIVQLNTGSDHIYDCGAAGTVLRFLSVRLSRKPGRHILKGTPRLMQRSHDELLKVFNQLNVKCELQSDRMIIESDGWKLTEPLLKVSRGTSSQFTSGLLLNSWNLEHDLKVKTTGANLSEGYLAMTLNMLSSLGMNIVMEKDPQDGETIYLVQAGAQIQRQTYQVECDLSSAFAVAAFAALNGKAQILEFPSPSLQPDYEFISILTKMGIEIKLESSPLNTSGFQLQINKTDSYQGAEANIQSCPDLFPVLATLCAFADTPSHLYGAPHLIHKESNRVAKVSELLTHLKIHHEPLHDGMKIYPSKIKLEVPAFEFDTDDDHRMAFAAALVQSKGYSIKINNPEVTTKSFPEFWKLVGLESRVCFNRNI